MEASSETVLPSPQPTDSSEVVEALSAAVNLWPTDPREALRALRRAAESAADAGDDSRSLELAKAAADLRSAANLGTSMAPGAAPMVLLSPISSFQSPGFQAASLPGVNSGVATDAALSGVALVTGSSSAPTATQPGIGVPVTSETGSPPEPASNAGEEVKATDALQDRPTPTAGLAAQAAVPALTPSVTVDAVHAGLFAITTHDPGQTVPATPAASAAAAVHTIPTGYATVMAAPVTMGGGLAGGAGSNGLSASAAIAAQHPTPVEVPAARRPSWDPSRRPGSPPGGFAAVRSLQEPGQGALIEHRALRVGVSQTVNAQGNFEFVVLREGAPLPSGWRECLLVALDSNQMLVPVA